eukprot:s854_g4.t1
MNLLPPPTIAAKDALKRRVVDVPAADPRSKCYRATFDYIKTKRPKAALLETVPGVVRNKRLKKMVYAKWLAEFLGPLPKHARKMLALGLRKVKEMGGNPSKQIWLIDVGATKKFQNKPKRLTAPTLTKTRASGGGFYLTKACTVRLPDKAVSARHCQRVEFVDTSLNGTWVSGEKVNKNRHEPKLLEHGANIIVEAESSSNFFSFMLDMRNTGLAFGDPRELPRGLPSEGSREVLRFASGSAEAGAGTRQVEEAPLGIAAASRETGPASKPENDIIQKEQLFYELQAQRKDIDARSHMWQAERLGRWNLGEASGSSGYRVDPGEDVCKAQGELYKQSEAAAVPLTEKTIHKQEEVGKLEMQLLGSSWRRAADGTVLTGPTWATLQLELAHCHSMTSQAILEQAKQLEGAIRDLEQRKLQLQKEVKSLEEEFAACLQVQCQECELKRGELADHTQRYAELNEFVPAGDEVLTLDVAGEIFRVYRSTLQQVEGSVLSTLASGRWPNPTGSSTADGQIFLDCNPRSFQEILEFLRELRVDCKATSSFSRKAANLAEPGRKSDWGRVKEDMYLLAEFQRAGDAKIAPGFMFDVMISGPWLCTLHAISFSMGQGGKVKVFGRKGSWMDSRTSPEGWQELAIGDPTLIAGQNRLQLPRGEAGATMLGPYAVMGIYLTFLEGADQMSYSDKMSQTNHKVLSEHCIMSDGMKLLCLKGRVSGAQPFSVGTHGEDRALANLGAHMVPDPCGRGDHRNNFLTSLAPRPPRVNELEREIYPDRFALAELPEEVSPADGLVTLAQLWPVKMWLKGLEETDNEQENTPGPGQPENEPQTSAPQQQVLLAEWLWRCDGIAVKMKRSKDSGAYQHDSGAYQHDSAPAIDSAKFEEEVMEMVAENSAQASASAEAANSAEMEPASKRPRVEKVQVPAFCHTSFKMLPITWQTPRLVWLTALCWMHGRSEDAVGWSPVKNMPQRDTAPYFALIRTDYKTPGWQGIDREVAYSIDILIDPCRDLVRAGGRGSACCKDQNIAGCQHHPDIEAGQDLQVAYMQNAHIASCRGTDFEYDPNCGTYLEVHRPGTKEVLSDVRIDAQSFPSGYQTVFLATHRLCRGQYEVWWVVRTRSGPYVQRTRSFYVSSPTCETPPGEGSRVKGYEPKTSFTTVGLDRIMEVVGRSQSVPVVGRTLNPFWSERTQEDAVLESSRPSTLPVLDGINTGVGSQAFSLSTGPTGKGRGGSSAGMLEPLRSTVDGRDDWKTEGVMPSGADVPQVPQTMGPVNPPRVEPGQGSTDDLQRALEAEMVNFLREQNSKLQGEVAALRSQLDKSGVSSSPWSTVGGTSSGDQQNGSVGSGQTGRNGRHGSRTPRCRTREAAVSPEFQSRKPVGKYTPNGTKVPDGPPPDDLPPVPPIPFVEVAVKTGELQQQSSFVSGIPMDDGLDIYDTCESKPKVRNGDSGWKPVEERGDVLSAREAKQMWLEREVQSLKFALDRPHEGNRASAHGDLFAHDRASLLHGDLCAQGRASTVHGDLLAQARALNEHGDPRGRDRALFEHGGHRDEARAGMHGGSEGARGSHLPLPHLGSHLPLLKGEVGAQLTLG